MIIVVLLNPGHSMILYVLPAFLIASSSFRILIKGMWIWFRMTVPLELIHFTTLC